MTLSVGALSMAVALRLGGWRLSAYVTTFISEIKRDMTKYEVRISGGDAHNEQQVKAIATISGVNFVTARKLLQEPESAVFKGHAVKAIEIRDALEKLELHTELHPSSDID